MTGSPAPVVVFAYNRPDHLRQTLNALAEADLVSRSPVCVYADGPRDEAARPGVEAVRRVLEDPSWRERFGAFEVHAGTTNKGLAKSIIEGVGQVVEAAGRVIVLEDDLIVSRDFLRFMNDALDFYCGDPTIGSISGFCPLKAPPPGYAHDVMRVPRNCSHGWATWADRWREVDWTAADYARLRRDRALRCSFNRAGADRYDRLERQLGGRIDSWSIRFGLWQFVTGRDTIYPTRNRVQNIGFDNSGVHTRMGQEINGLLVDRAPYRLTNPHQDDEVLAAFRRTYSGGLTNRLGRTARAIVRSINYHGRLA